MSCEVIILILLSLLMEQSDELMEFAVMAAAAKQQ